VANPGFSGKRPLKWYECVQHLMYILCCLIFQHGGANVTKLQLRLSLYDSTYKQFFGRTWIGPFADVKRGSKLAYNQVHYCKVILSKVLMT